MLSAVPKESHLILTLKNILLNEGNSSSISTRYRGDRYHVNGTQNALARLVDDTNENIPLSHTKFKSRFSNALSGEEYPLMIQHSVMGCRKNWKPVAQKLNKLCNIDVITIDARNHGESKHSIDMSYQSMSDDVNHLIDHLSLGKVNFLGQGMGANVGMSLALMFPYLIKSLVCIDTCPVKDFQSNDLDLENIRMSINALKSIFPDLWREKSIVQRRIVADKAIRTILSDPKQRSLLLSNLNPESNCDQLFKMNLDAFTFNTDFSSSMFSIWSSGSICKQPTLFIANRKIAKDKDAYERHFKSKFPMAKFIWSEGSGPMQLEEPEKFLSVVSSFLQR